MYWAKPNLNNNNGMKCFETKELAAKYLKEVTGIEMSYEKCAKTGERIYDWELIGKIFEK